VDKQAGNDTAITVSSINSPSSAGAADTGRVVVAAYPLQIIPQSERRRLTCIRYLRQMALAENAWSRVQHPPPAPASMTAASEDINVDEVDETGRHTASRRRASLAAGHSGSVSHAGAAVWDAHQYTADASHYLAHCSAGTPAGTSPGAIAAATNAALAIALGKGGGVAAVGAPVSDMSAGVVAVAALTGSALSAGKEM